MEYKVIKIYHILRHMICNWLKRLNIMRPESKTLATPTLASKSPDLLYPLDIVPHVLLYLEACPMSEKTNVEAL